METISNSASVLRLYRIQAGLRQCDIAKPINRSVQFVHRLETGGPALLTAELAEAIGNLLAISPAILFGEAYRTRGAR
jgi:transcriptional regulator with XRE-family HTH domain